MKHLFIINPVAGKGKSNEYKEKIQEIFKDREDEYKIEETKYVGHATEIVKKYTENENYRVYSIGGDGTLNEILNGIVNTKSSLAIIPAGSGNDFIRSIVKDFKETDLLYKTINGKEKKVDLAKINDRYFINISSIGFDANVVNNARKYKSYKYVTGPVAYFISVITTAFKFRPINMSIRIDDKKISEDILLLAVANGKYYGGGIKIAPYAELSDGMLEVYAVKKVSLFKLLRSINKVMKGTHTYSVDEVMYSKAKKINVKCHDDFIVNIDGEIIKNKELTFEIVPKGIEIVNPQEVI